MFGVFFFFKQKTEYEMRISDWSSDVCSSDLLYRNVGYRRHRHREDDGRHHGGCEAPTVARPIGEREMPEIDRVGQSTADNGDAGSQPTREKAGIARCGAPDQYRGRLDRKSTRLNSSH